MYGEPAFIEARLVLEVYIHTYIHTYIYIQGDAEKPERFVFGIAIVKIAFAYNSTVNNRNIKN